MEITWLGHAAFHLQGNGYSIVTDPYDPEGSGLDPIGSRADLVVMSSALDEAHSSWEQVPGDPQVVNALDAVDAPIPLGDDVLLNAIAASEGSDRPDDPKANAMYWLDLDGVVVFHMGDIGTPLTPEQATRLPERVDVLLALAGAKLTIALPDLDTVIDRLDPRIVVPMHFATPKLRYDVGPLEDFLLRRGADRIEIRDGPSATITPSSLPESRTVLVLKPLNG
jgi:L-ascorbate metabolism protein UlaG (beta-lactamase superfamily)